MCIREGLAYTERFLRGPLYLLLILTLLILVIFVLIGAFGTQHVRIEARAGTVEIDFAPGQPIAWATPGAELLDCKYFAQITSSDNARRPKPAPMQMGDGAELLIGGIVDKDQSKKVRAKASVHKDSRHGDGLIVELSHPDGPACTNPTECLKQSSNLVILDNGSGSKSSICLPAQVRVKGDALTNGLTLEFRGDIRIGNDLTSSVQPQLTSGRFAIWEVRPGSTSWWEGWIEPQFEIEKRELGLGDKMLIAAPVRTKSRTVQTVASDASRTFLNDDAPKGFVRIAAASGDKAPELTVYAASPTKWTKIVRPFSPPEEPKAHWLKRLWADDLVSKTAAVIAALVSIRSGLLPSQNDKDRPAEKCQGKKKRRNGNDDDDRSH
jgi:hypothetical protein